MRSAQPKPGDVTVCFTCGHVNIFDVDLELRHPTVAELIEIGNDREVTMIRDAILRRRAH